MWLVHLVHLTFWHQVSFFSPMQFIHRHTELWCHRVFYRCLWFIGHWQFLCWLVDFVLWLDALYTWFYDSCTVPVLLWCWWLISPLCVCVLAPAQGGPRGYCFSTWPIFNLARGILILKWHWLMQLIASGTDQENNDFHKSVTTVSKVQNLTAQSLL